MGLLKCLRCVVALDGVVSECFSALAFPRHTRTFVRSTLRRNRGFRDEASAYMGRGGGGA